MSGTSLVPAVRAEFTKARSIRSTVVALALFALISVAIGVLDGWSSRTAIESHNPALRPDFSPAQAGFDGILYGQLALIVFGVLAVSSEYGTGMVGLSLLAVPRRGTFFVAKIVVAALSTLLIAVPATVLTYLATEFALGTHGASLLADGVPRAMLGAIGYLTLMCMLAAGAAMMSRSAILPLAVLLPLVLAGSQILSVIGATKQLARYLPDQAGMRMLAVHPADGGKLSPLAGTAVLVAWTVVVLAGGFAALRNRDA
jgi:ABC-type transport system involved in multi-copper enzyme maturation permease subunit